MDSNLGRLVSDETTVPDVPLPMARKIRGNAIIGYTTNYLGE